MLDHHSQVSLHLPQCPICGMPMSIARIEPDPRSDSPSNRFTYECSQGHNVAAISERKG
jgi:hypothetical protein